MWLELNVDLQFSGFMAEEIADSSVWVKKSHDPQPGPPNKGGPGRPKITHKAHKIVCCVRNPFDVAVSKMHFASKNQGG